MDAGIVPADDTRINFHLPVFGFIMVEDPAKRQQVVESTEKISEVFSFLLEKVKKAQ